METFSKWIRQQLKSRRWSLRELARQSGVSHPMLSRAISGKANFSADSIVKIAQAFDQPPADVLRLAGILPDTPESSDDPALTEAVEILRKLPPDQIQQALDYLRFLRQQRRS
jgi:transcriptional regulator with XRE-family HTH domain